MPHYVTSNHKNKSLAINPKLLIGIGWKVLSCACFAGVNTIVRYLSGNTTMIKQPLPILIIIFFQTIISTILLIPFIFPRNISIKSFLITKLMTKNINLQLLRILLSMLAILLWYYSLTNMPVIQAIAMSFISPILTFIGAVIFLKEKLTPKKFIAIILSIIGGILISKSDLLNNHNQNLELSNTKNNINHTNNKIYNFHDLRILSPIIAGLLFSLDKLITRKILIRNECPKITTLYVLFFSIPLFFILILITNSWICPNYSNFFILLLTGILGAAANFAFTKSIATAEITSIMPYGITKLIFSAILSYLVFNETLNTFNMWLGVIIISISTILLL